MLETITWHYTQQSEAAFFAVGVVAILGGGLASALFLPPNTDTLSRSFYFLRIGLASVLLAANQVWWLFYVPALKLGLSGVMLITDILGCAAYGAYVIHVAQARARDAYGTPARAWFALVPIANLVLLFKPSMQPNANRGSNAAVAAGLLLIFISRSISGALLPAVEARTAAALDDPAAVQALNDLRLAAEGPEVGLDQIIAAEAAPVRIAPDLMLTAVRRQGLHLTYDFRFDQSDVGSLNDDYRRDVAANFCDNLLGYMQKGARVTLLYSLPDGTEVDRLELTLTSCTT